MNEQQISNFEETLNIGFAIWFGGIGVLLWLYTIYISIMAKQTKRWATVKGRILKSDVEEFTLETSEDDLPGVKPSIEYEYTIQGRPYIGHKIYHGFLDYLITADLRKITNRFKESDEVDVYYNELNPVRSVLVPGLHKGIIYGWVCGLIAVGTAVGILYVFYK